MQMDFNLPQREQDEIFSAETPVTHREEKTREDLWQRRDDEALT